MSNNKNGNAVKSAKTLSNQTVKENQSGKKHSKSVRILGKMGE